MLATADSADLKEEYVNNAGKRSLISILLLASAIIALVIVLWPSRVKHEAPSILVSEGPVVKLPSPAYTSRTPVEKALSERRSVRTYTDSALTLSEISQLLWAAQGITQDRKGLRAAPSAGALYPLEVYVLSGNVKDLPAGIYRYRPLGHELVNTADGDKRQELYSAARNQTSVREAPAAIVFSARYGRTNAKYGERGVRYVNAEAGAAVENIYLQAVSLGLGTVVIGAFGEGDVKAVIRMTAEEEPLYIMPVGRKGGR
ncbi:MAG: SagB/ThcOx family dehydrogenase [Candidatus Sulfobium sp.]|jgi:SagB-type dehydrogenase family enzyme